ncbi:outer membrane protein A [Neisseria zoodegmatis]|uniref:Outer membrane protein A n=1 Tax=Neisseria zoodegmatis TaxID=326523 RepID=A0A378WVJ3_9NEIS|nr:OmpA family protein [Neisseria zoodegmatis]SUA44353.1 outer membrane protein A [Neisseria zoodegmatis]
MSFDLGNLLQSQLGGVLSRFLTQSGESAENSTKAVRLALPAVVAGMLKHISNQPDNAANLYETVSGVSGNVLNNAVSRAEEGGAGFNDLLVWGKTQLPHFLGGNAADVSDQLSQESGVSKSAAGSLVALSLPLVLSVLRNKIKSENLDRDQMLGLFSSQRDWLSGSLSNGMLSALGIGSLSGLFGSLTGLFGTAARTATAGAAAAAAAPAAAAAATKGSGLGKWIALVLAALLALFAFKSCGDRKGGDAAPAVASGEAVASEAEAVADKAAEPVEASPVSAPVMPSEPSVVSAPSAVEASAPAADAVAPADLKAEEARVLYQDGVAKFYFATAKADVPEGAEVMVADVIAAGKAGKKLVVSGFADSTGNAAANAALSKKRANAVKAFFEAQGVDAANIELRKPENTTGAIGNDVEGRRVEVKVEG